MKRGGKPRTQKNLSEQRRELTTNSTHIWHLRLDMNTGDTAGWRELAPRGGGGGGGGGGALPPRPPPPPPPPPPPCSKADTQPFYKFDLTKFVITYRLTITFLLRM